MEPHESIGIKQCQKRKGKMRDDKKSIQQGEKR
jgi:hypothetical protein